MAIGPAISEFAVKTIALGSDHDTVAMWPASLYLSEVSFAGRVAVVASVGGSSYWENVIHSSCNLVLEFDFLGFSSGQGDGAFLLHHQIAYHLELLVSSFGSN